MNNIPKIGERVEVASRYIEKCEKLLDIGCGEGFIKGFLRGKVKKVFGLDKSIKSLSIARGKGIITKCVDLNKQIIPYEDNYFDIVICLDVIEHIIDPLKFLKDIHRVLKTDGKFIISAPNIRFSNHLFQIILKGHFPTTSMDKLAYDGGHIHYFTIGDLKNLLYKTNYSVLKEVGIINKKERGVKGKIGEKILGKKFMREFRSGGILIVARKK